MKSEKLYLVHIVEAHEIIKEYVAFGKDEFLKSHLIQNAMIKVLGNITESVGKLNDTSKEEFNQIPFKEIRSFRNQLTHDYLEEEKSVSLYMIIDGEEVDVSGGYCDNVQAFGNILAHNYDGEMNYEMLWGIINNDLPQLVDVARKILEEKYAINN